MVISYIKGFYQVFIINKAKNNIIKRSRVIVRFPIEKKFSGMAGKIIIRVKKTAAMDGIPKIKAIL